MNVEARGARVMPREMESRSMENGKGVTPKMKGYAHKVTFYI